MGEDLSQYLGIFLDEASEQLELLEKDILQLEQGASQELLQEIFRAAHTLKGSSRAMNFLSMGELTHAMEDVLDQLRHGELAVHGALIDALFQAVDALKALKEEIAATGTGTLDTAEQTARLRAVLNASSVPSPPGSESPASASGLWELSEAEQGALEAALAAEIPVFRLTVEIASDCLMKSVRALMVLQALERVGSVLATCPGEDAIENEAFAQTFEIAFASQQAMEAIQATAESVTEIVRAAIHPWQPPEAAAPSAREADLPQTRVESESPSPGTESAHLGGVPHPGVENPRLGGVPPGVLPDAKTIPLLACPPARTLRIGSEGLQSVAMGGVPPVDERILDAGPEARGKPEAEVQKLAAEKKGSASGVQAQTVRVDVARLDKLLNLVGELVIDRTRIAQIGAEFERKFEFHALVENLNETAAHVGRITDELQEEIMKARMLPIDNVFNRFPRMIRDLARKLGKEVNLIVAGRETELDRSVIEVIGDPLIHMLRNSVDHGIEMPEERERQGKPRAGTVWLRARHEENHIVIEIQDDGRGIDPEKLRRNAVEKGIMSPEAAHRLTDKEAVNLIFGAGFSTASVVSEVSGRGVGMDIVRSNLQKLGAQIDIESKVGAGSTFLVRLPLTLAIIRGLLVTVRGSVYALPLASVVETVKVEADAVHIIAHREVVVQRGRTLPIVRLRDVFRLEAGTTPAERALNGSPQGEPEAAPETTPRAEDSNPGVTARQEGKPDALYLVIVGLAEKQIGLAVDSLVGEQEIVIKTLGKFIGDIRGISGATILGDGRVALIVDANGLAHLALEEKGKAYAA